MGDIHEHPTPEQSRWLKLLIQHHPQDGDPPNVPDDVLAELIAKNLAHLRHGVELEITFDGIRAIREGQLRQCA